MLRWAVLYVLIYLGLDALGFIDFAVPSATIAKVPLFIVMGIFLVFLTAGLVIDILILPPLPVQ
jgi:uncharacterized membrane protein YtjA (UPF0391 family)